MARPNFEARQKKPDGTAMQNIVFSPTNLPAASELEPIKTFTQTGFIASGDSNPAGWYYFANFKPIDNYKQWHIRCRVRLNVPYSASNSQYMNYDGYVEIWGYGYSASYTCYKNWNCHSNTSYRTFYHYELYRCASAADTLNYGYLLGFRFQSAAYVTNTNYKRNITIDLLEYDNCTWDFFDELTLRANVPNTAKFTANSELDGANNGLRESGDDNTTTLVQLNSERATVGSIPLSGLSVYGLSAENKFEGLSAYNSTYSSYTTSLSTARVYSTAGWDLSKQIKYGYFWAGYVVGTTATVSGCPIYAGFDFRYSDNCVPLGSSAGCNFGFWYDKPVYVRGTISNNIFVPAPYDAVPVIINGYYTNSAFRATNSTSGTVVTLSTAYVYYDLLTSKYYKCTNTSGNGAYTLLGDTWSSFTGNKYRKAWTQTLPTTEDGYYYLYLGKPYYNSSYIYSGYQLNLEVNHAIYYYTNGSLHTYVASTDYLIEDSLPIVPGAYIDITQSASGAEVAVKATTTVTSGSADLVTSGGVYTAINAAIDNAITTALNADY